MSLLNLPGMTSQGQAYMRQLEKLADREVAVGFLSGKRYPGGESVVEVAAKNEFGESGIPARPFLKQMADKRGPKVTEAAQEMAGRLADGASAEAELRKLGELAVDLVVEEINSGDFVPNAPSTVARKGRNSPLIDTGRMRDSVEFKVRPKS